jgi:hypothetical protein
MFGVLRAMGLLARAGSFLYNIQGFLSIYVRCVTQLSERPEWIGFAKWNRRQPPLLVASSAMSGKPDGLMSP